MQAGSSDPLGECSVSQVLAPYEGWRTKIGSGIEGFHGNRLWDYRLCREHGSRWHIYNYIYIINISIFILHVFIVIVTDISIVGGKCYAAT